MIPYATAGRDWRFVHCDVSISRPMFLELALFRRHLAIQSSSSLERHHLALTISSVQINLASSLKHRSSFPHMTASCLLRVHGMVIGIRTRGDGSSDNILDMLESTQESQGNGLSEVIDRRIARNLECLCLLQSSRRSSASLGTSSVGVLDRDRGGS
jgi:hypothetical protein